jgi:hypothetical protein
MPSHDEQETCLGTLPHCKALNGVEPLSECPPVLTPLPAIVTYHGNVWSLVPGLPLLLLGYQW